MSLGVGNIVSLGGGSTGGGGGVSGITTINPGGNTGPIVTFEAINGISITSPSANTLLIDGAALSGLIVPSGGIGGINGQIGPHIEMKGVNGILVTVPTENCILFDGAGVSGTVTKFAESFTGITSGIFSHNLGTEDVVVQVHNGETARRLVMMPDQIIIENSNQVSVLFNRPQTGRIIII